ncbi:MAG: hypothetical protein LBL51_05720, partial [Synergistaceae bacterium]|nr:hypothetical protein [Synergistaceae bacterium]
SDGVIWLKRVACALAPDGGVERRTLWVILGRTGLSGKWLEWNIPVPKGGKAEILEASVYSPGTGGKLKDVVPVNWVQGETVTRSVSFIGLPEEFILAVSYREFFADSLTLENVVWTGESLPVWETLVQVTAPSGHPFYHASAPSAEPEVRALENSGGALFYEWRIINTEAIPQFSPRRESRGYVAFGARKGGAAAARLLRSLETAGAVPDSFPKMTGRPDAKGLENYLKKVHALPEIVLPEGLSRSVPPEAPWTPGEKALLAYRRMRDAKVNARLFWRLAFRPGEDSPVCEAVVVSPVLAISPSSSSVFYYDASSPGADPFAPVSLWEETIYGTAGADSLEERTVKGAGVSENRLSAFYDLTLDENGIMNGTIRVSARQGWNGLLPSSPSSGDLRLFLEGLFPRLPRYEKIEFKERKNEREIVVTLAGTQTILGTGGRHILASIPPLIPAWFRSLSSGPSLTLRFPFTLEAKVRLNLPRGANISLPPLAGRDAGKIKAAFSYKLLKKRTLAAEARVTVRAASMTADESAGLDAAFQGWSAFMTNTLPIQLSAGGRK